MLCRNFLVGCAFNMFTSKPVTAWATGAPLSAWGAYHAPPPFPVISLDNSDTRHTANRLPGHVLPTFLSYQVRKHIMYIGLRL